MSLQLRRHPNPFHPVYRPHNRDAKLQAKPSIAILTFTNLSSDLAQRYFSDGITADIVTELSRFHQLQVRAQRNSTNGERPVLDAAKAGHELGVQYVVEGSVRRLEQRVRINVQLVDVDTGGHLWAERFDANEDEIFTMQDHIVRSIAAQLSVRLQLADLEKASRKPPNSMAAYDYVLRGHALPVGVPEAEAEARRLFQKAIDIDPGYARAYASPGGYHIFEWSRDLDTPAATLDRSLELTKRPWPSTTATISATPCSVARTCSVASMKAGLPLSKSPRPQSEQLFFLLWPVSVFSTVFAVIPSAV